MVFDLTIVRQGPTLSNCARSSLIAPVTLEKINKALFSIDAAKAPGLDDFNAKFYTETWPIIKLDIYAAVIDFFL